MKAKFVAALITGAAILIAAPMWAATVDFQFANCAEISGVPCPNTDSTKTTLTYEDTHFDSTPVLTVVGTDPDDASTDDLYVKLTNLNPLDPESGLGFTSEANHEIDTTSFIQMNVSTLLTAGFTGGTITISSTAGDSFKVCTSSTVGTLVGILGSCSPTIAGSGTGQNTVPVTFDPTNTWIGVEAVTGNVLLTEDLQATTSTADEPSALLLLAITLGAGLLALRKFNNRCEA